MLSEADGAKEKSISVLRRFFSVARSFRMWMLLTAGCMLLEAMANVLASHTIAEMVDIAQAGSWEKLPGLTVALPICISVWMFFQFWHIRFSGRYSIRTMESMRNHSVTEINRLSIAYLDESHSGDLISRVNRDLVGIESFVEETVPNFLYFAIFLVSVSIYLFITQWMLSLIAFIVVPLLLWLTMRISKKAEDLETDMSEVNSVATQLELDSVHGYNVVKAFSREDEMRRRMDVSTEEIARSNWRLHRLRTLLLFPLARFSGSLPTLVVGGIGGLLIFRGQMTLGELTAFIALFGNISGAIQFFGFSIGDTRSAIAKMRRIFEIWDAPKERTGGKVAAPDRGLALTLRDVNFAYTQEGGDVIRGLSFSVTEGETVALVGGSGCGKSTVLKLMMGFYPPSRGKVSIYDLDTDTWDLRALHSHMAWVGQDTFLFPGTLYDNIACAKEDATEEEVVEACKEADIWGFICEQPLGLQTLAGERGVRLSGGQRQRISIARALIKNAPILFLDEATSALDAHAEMEVQRALESLMRGRTTVMVAHRLSSLRNARRVLCMQEGRIVQEGSHEELIGQEGVYATLYAQQADMEKEA